MFLVFVGAFPRQPVMEEATLVPVQHVGSNEKTIFQMVTAKLALPTIDMNSVIVLGLCRRAAGPVTVLIGAWSAWWKMEA